MKISAILISTRKEYPAIVMERLTLGFFDEILVHTECPNIYSRYLLAKKAKNSCIYFQDDDALLNYQHLHKHYDNNLTNAMPLSFKAKYDEMGCTLVGWGMFAPKHTINVLDKYIAAYGEDEHLLREADRIYTYFNKQLINTIIMPHEDLFQDENRMSSPENYAAHMASANEALRKCSLL